MKNIIIVSKIIFSAWIIFAWCQMIVLDEPNWTFVVISLGISLSSLILKWWLESKLDNQES